MQNALPPNNEHHARTTTTTQAALLCPNCNQPYRAGEIICSHCGTVLSRIGQTGFLNAPTDLSEQSREPRGDAFLTEQCTISLHVNTRMLTLPPAETQVIGRFSADPADQQPDIDLDTLGAKELGVSRRHIQISYRNEMVYVSDLGSSNGTWLNGHRLFANTERVLRSGDELVLGTFKMTVTF